MDDAGLMRGVERVSDLLRDRERFFEGQWTGVESFGERWSFDELNYERARPTIFDAVDRPDIRWFSDASTRASRRTRPIDRDPRPLLRQDLDGDVATSLVSGARQTSPMPPAPSSD